MPLSFRSFKWRCLLSLSLVYSCVPQQHMQTIPSPSASPPVSPTPSALPSPQSSPTPSDISLVSPTLPFTGVTELRLLSASEIEILRESGLVEANNAFAWDLFSAIDQEEPQTNHFISPLSASLALQMELQGARGETLAEMQKALHLTDYRLEELLPLTSLFLRKLHQPASDVTLEVANSFWVDQGYTFLPAFQKTLREVFLADAFSVPLQDLKTNAQINQWTAEKTHQAIPEIVDPNIPMDPMLVSLLINAVYFKGDWTYQFEEIETEKKSFYLEDGNTIEVDMMRQFGGYRYLSPSDRFPHQGLILPYGKDEKVAMYLFLPTTGQTLSDLKTDLQQVGFDNLLPNFHAEGGSIQIPRFRMTQTIDMIPALKTLGIERLFAEGLADLSGMMEQQLFVSQVEQFTQIEVKEEGTESAAVTVISNNKTSSEPLKTLDMRVDHPFFFLIRDEDTGQILFMGSVTDPR